MIGVDDLDETAREQREIGIDGPDYRNVDGVWDDYFVVWALRYRAARWAPRRKEREAQQRSKAVAETELARGSTFKERDEHPRQRDAAGGVISNVFAICAKGACGPLKSLAGLICCWTMPRWQG